MQKIMQRDSPDVLNTGRETWTKHTILLVEDEEMVRALMCEVLEREGYQVLPCSHPQEGIEVSRSYGGQIDLLLTDVVMPGMNGRDMADQILQILPHLRVVFMSGYTEHVLTRDGDIDPQVEYLQKPFTLQTLVQRLEQVLGKERNRRNSRHAVIDDEDTYGIGDWIRHHIRNRTETQRPDKTLQNSRGSAACRRGCRRNQFCHIDSAPDSAR